MSAQRDLHFIYMRLDDLVAKVDLYAAALRGVAGELAARGMTLEEAREAIKDPAKAQSSGKLDPERPDGRASTIVSEALAPKGATDG